jgi:hypothetical protein
MAEDVYRLALLANALDEAGIEWWLDHGTLLGITREGRLLPWDEDVDLSIHHEQLEDTWEVVARLRGLVGGRLVLTTRNVKILPWDTGQRVIDIGAYREVDADSVVKTLVMFPRTPGLRAGRLRRWAWRRLRSLEARLAQRYVANRRSPTARPSPLLVHLARAREGVGVPHSSTVPREHFARIARRAWRGIELPVPHDPEGYLEFRYGPDWRTPQESWLWWKSDRSVRVTGRG